MSITSETQRKYDPNKGGFSYYTLFHADKDERPSWAQDGDMLEEFGEGGKVYVCSRDAKGRIKWTEDATWDRQTGGTGGGGLPADFPAEGIANADKFLGFDENGDYAALDAPSGAEKFVVTITDNAGVTSNKTVAEILAAKAAGKEVVAHVTSSTYSGQVIELPLMWSFTSERGSAVFFSGCAPRLGQVLTEAVYSVYCLAQTGQEEVWGSDFVELGEGVPSYSSSNNGQVLGVSSGDLAWVDANAPLIVTMTEDKQNAGTYVGNKTAQECVEAYAAGRNVVFNLTISDSPVSCSALNAAVIEDGGVTDYSLTVYIAAGAVVTDTAAGGYVSFTVGG